MERFSPPKLLPSMDIIRFQESLEEREWREPFSFILGADTQIGLIALKLGETEPDWSREIAYIREAIQKINKMSPLPRFFCVCGDILDAYPFLMDKPSGDIFRREKQYRDFVEVFKELDPKVKLICVCGNHDMGDFPTREAVTVYRRQFGQDYFSFWVGGVKFVVLNSQYMFAPEAVPEETKRQEEFMETIADPSAKHIMVFQHIPYFALDPNEDQCANLNIARPQRHTYLEKLQNSGVRYIFCGHHHINMENSYKDITQIVTGPLGAALCSDPSGFRVVTVDATQITHEYIPLGDVNLCNLNHLRKEAVCICESDLFKNAKINK